MQWWCAAGGVAWDWSWRAYPGVWLFILVAAGMGGWVWRSAPQDEKGSRGLYALGVLFLWAALDWPVGALGAGYLASLHMVQFLLLTLLAPPFLILGWPQGALVRCVNSRGTVGWAIRVVTHPLVALGIFAVTLGWTHWPPAVDALMVTQWGSFLLDLSWLVAGLVFWWPVVGPSAGRPWLTDPFRMGYLFVGSVVSAGVFVYLTYSSLPVYGIYELAPPFPGLSTRDDQVVAGLLMKGGGALVIWSWITVLFFRWNAREGDHY